jgi:hypothetical protein
VRARKKPSIYADPSIKYEPSSARFKTLNVGTSPIKIWGVRKPTKLPALNDDVDASLYDPEKGLLSYPSQAKLVNNRRNS